MIHLNTKTHACLTQSTADHDYYTIAYITKGCKSPQRTKVAYAQKPWSCTSKAWDRSYLNPTALVGYHCY